MLTREQIDATLPLIQRGLARYLALTELKSLPLYYNDPSFRRAFNGFYRVRRNTDFQNVFFPLLAVPGIDFRSALNRIHEATGRFEASFASKLISTLDPGRPVIDRHVLRNAGLRLPGQHDRDRMDRTVRTYEELEEMCLNFINRPEGAYLVERFNTLYPHAAWLPSMKKLDLVLWKLRD